jgi:hypothetical protein
MADPRPPRRPGNPPLAHDDTSVDVHLTMTGRDYDDAYRRASRERVSVQEIIRRDIRQGSRNPK